jgi:sarcosine oxidase
LEPRRQHHQQTEVVVIGGGVVGAAATLAVARSGASVAMLERSPGPIAEGSSRGSARIFAPAAYPDESYLEPALRALERWQEIERQSGERLLWRTGALTYGEFADRELPALRAGGVAVELLSADPAASRFGVRLAGGRPLIYQPDAGVLRADRARTALLGLARAAGAELHLGERVLSLTERDDAIVVETDRRRWNCSATVVAAGPWSGALLADAGIELPVNVSLQSVAYFELAERSARPVALIEFEGDEPFACWDPERGLKAAFHARGPSIDPECDPRDPDPTAIDRVSDWVRDRYGDLVGAEPSRVETCMYTNAPGERFVIERRGRIVIGSACNGQGFQFAPQTGERLAELALETHAAGVATTGAAR